MTRSRLVARAAALAATLLAGASAQAQVDERLPITMPAVGSISSTPEPAVREWSGQAGASGHPLMSVEASRT